MEGEEEAAAAVRGEAAEVRLVERALVEELLEDECQRLDIGPLGCGERA